MLAAMRGRTIAFVGDSTMQQLWTGLVAELFAARHPIEITHRVPDYNMLPGFYNKDAVCTMVRTIKPQKPPSVGGSETQFRLDASAYPQSCNLTSYRGGFVGPQSKWPMYALCYSAADVEMWVPSADLRFLFYRVDHNGTKNMKAAHRRFYSHCNTHKLNFDANLDAAIRRSDAVIANIGVWYNSEAQSEAYRSAVGHVMRRLNSLAPLGKVRPRFSPLARDVTAPHTVGKGQVPPRVLWILTLGARHPHACRVRAALLLALAAWGVSRVRPAAFSDADRLWLIRREGRRAPSPPKALWQHLLQSVPPSKCEVCPPHGLAQPHRARRGDCYRLPSRRVHPVGPADETDGFAAQEHPLELQA